MTLKLNMEAELCERLKALGYTKDSRMRIYGEEFDRTSNPVSDENGFAVEAVSRKSGSTRKLRTPMSIVRMITTSRRILAELLSLSATLSPVERRIAKRSDA